MSKRVSCKFFAQGSCTKGVHCKFGHDRNYRTDSKRICFYYQRGNCTYGSRCRYEHVDTPRQPISAPSKFQAHLASSSSQIPHNPIGSSINGEKATSSRPRCLQNHVDRTCAETLAKQPLCNLAITGDCPHGEKCLHIHGSLCSACKKHCLHPYRHDEREEHIKMCQQNKQMEILKLSEEMECCVCLERVLSKATADERKFGLLSECDHSFCISCIRNWRNNSPDSGMDVNTALRACPVCRRISYFVVPSALWYSTKEEKQEIISTYKNRLKSIDCKHFDFGSGSCPFRNKCFYRHLYRPGRSRSRQQSNRQQSNRPQNRYITSSDFMDELDLMLADSLHLDDFDFNFYDFSNIGRFLDLEEEEEEDDDDEDSSGLEMAGMLTRLIMELSVDDDGIDESEDEDEDDESDDEVDGSDGAGGTCF